MNWTVEPSNCFRVYRKLITWSTDAKRRIVYQMLDIIHQVMERWKGFPVWEDFIPTLSKFIATAQLTVRWDFPRILYLRRISYPCGRFNVWLVLACLCPLIILEIGQQCSSAKKTDLLFSFQLFTFYFNLCWLLKE